VRGVRLAVAKALRSVFLRWVWVRRLCSLFAEIARRALTREAVKHKYIGDYCEADRLWKAIEDLNRWDEKWGWVDWPKRYAGAWRREEKAESWSELGDSEPAEYNRLPDIKLEVEVRNPDGTTTRELVEPTLIETLIEEGVPADQDGGMVLHLYDGPSLSNRLIRDDKPLLNREPMGKGKRVKSYRNHPGARVQKEVKGTGSVQIAPLETGDVGFKIDDGQGGVFVWEFPIEAAEHIGQRFLESVRELRK